MTDLIEGGNKEFAAYVQSSKSVEELSSRKFTVVCGAVHRSSDTAFAVSTGEGQTLEIDIAAVERFKVVGTGLYPEVELSIATEALRAAKAIPFKSVLTDHYTIFGGDQKSIIKDIRTDPIADQTLYASDHKHLPKDIAKDPIFDPVNTSFQDNIGTLAETAVEGGGFDPGQVATNPAQAQHPAQAQQWSGAGMTPFVMATPHHAPSPMVNLQMAAAQTRVATAGLKPLQFETLKELSSDQTHKELVYDTHKELIYDTHKEVFETLVEGGGTSQEGSGTAAEGGQIPGGFPGMPGFY